MWAQINNKLHCEVTKDFIFDAFAFQFESKDDKKQIYIIRDNFYA